MIMELYMKKLYFILIFIMICNPLNSQQWELIEGRSLFCNPMIEGDTLIGINEDEWLVSYKNRAWDSINYMQKLLESIEDTNIKKDRIANARCINSFYKDKNHNTMFIFDYSSIFTKTDMIFYDYGTKILNYEYYKQIDSVNPTKIYHVYFVDFDKNNCPYFIISNLNERVDYVSVCKMEDNRIIEINKHKSSSYGSSSKRICFDSNNGYWVNVNDSLFYYENDEVSKRFGLEDLPKSDYIQGGFFTKVVTDSDITYVMTSQLALYTYQNNTWSFDSTFAFYQLTATLNAHDDEFQNINLDSQGCLWLYHSSQPFLFKRDKSLIWEKYLIPSARTNIDYGSGTDPNGAKYESNVIDSKDRIWLFTNWNGKYFIFTPPNN